MSRFTIQAHSDPQTLARLINYFAQRALVPARVRADEEGHLLSVVIEQPGLDRDAAIIIAEKMRNAPLVESVELRHGRSVVALPCDSWQDCADSVLAARSLGLRAATADRAI